MLLTSTLADIPSPSSGIIEIGPLSLTAYGLMIALGVIAAVWLFGRRLESRGIGTRDDASSIAVWAVIAGVIGARLYHVVTDWDNFTGDDGSLSDIPAIWEGGLGIPGGIIAGVPVGLWMVHRRGIPMAMAATCAAPALPLAQAIGRWGNWFNQELFGRPTDLPWGLEIDPENVPPGYIGEQTFHPTFLYESLWNLALFAVLLAIDRSRRLVAGSLMALYIAGYGLGRFWVEGLRIDEASEVAGLRWNQWMALIFVVLGLALFVWLQRHGRPERVVVAEAARAAVEDEAAEAGSSDEPVPTPADSTPPEGTTRDEIEGESDDLADDDIDAPSATTDDEPADERGDSKPRDDVERPASQRGGDWSDT